MGSKSFAFVANPLSTTPSILNYKLFMIFLDTPSILQ
jgi:hypothetical protein